MEDLKLIIAQNIVQLRKKSKLTQAELAEQLNYSDKAVSKWERGESVPDIAVLKQLADLFHVSVDYLLSKEHPVLAELSRQLNHHKKHNRGMITAISVLLVWLLATLVFVVLEPFVHHTPWQWMTFAYALPASLIVWLVFNSIWFNKRRNFFIISCLMWSVLLALYLSFLAAGINYPLLFVLGLIGQLIILLWSGIRLLPSKQETGKKAPEPPVKNSSGSDSAK